MKYCPFCCEEIHEKAVKCKYCQEWINPQSEKNLSKKAIHEWIQQIIHQSLQDGLEGKLYDKIIEEIERVLLIEILTFSKHNRSRASLILGISRPTLQIKLEKFNLN